MSGLFFNTYKRLPYMVERGEGCYLILSDGRKVLDMNAGIAVNLLGYNNARINTSITRQLNKYIHISNYFYDEQQNKLAEKIIKLSGYEKIFFTNSGTEATETAIKIVKKIFSGSAGKQFISFRGSFHGRTCGALTLTGRDKYRDIFLPLLPDVVHVNFNAADELFKTVNNNTAGVIFEAIQGEGGVMQMSESFAGTLKDLHESFGFILIADEIQTGLYRTGDLFAFRQYDLQPDIVLLAKGIGGGLPLGAVLGNNRVMDVFTKGEHGSTFGGNPVACAAGCAVIDEIGLNRIADNVAKVGDYLLKSLNNLKNKYTDKIADVRGRGLMIGIELKFDADELASAMLDKNVFVNVTNQTVIRLLPPLILSQKEASDFISVFEEQLVNYR